MSGNEEELGPEEREPGWGLRVTGQRTDFRGARKGTERGGGACVLEGLFKGETDQDEQRERLRPGDGRRKGRCQRQTKGDVLGESQRKCWSIALTF